MVTPEPVFADTLPAPLDCSRDCGANGFCEFTVLDEMVCSCRAGYEGDECQTGTLCPVCYFFFFFFYFYFRVPMGN